MPVSAQECAASASIDADPVTTAAIDFATADEQVGAEGDHTVLVLADPPVADAPRKRAKEIRLTVAWLVLRRWAHAGVSRTTYRRRRVGAALPERERSTDVTSC